MKRLLCASIFVLALCVVSFAQNNQSAPCPEIDILGPSGIPEPGEIVNYSFNIDENGKDLKLEYIWSINAGKIVSGQGTPQIEVEQPLMESLTVTIEVKGLPEGCPNTTSEAITISSSQINKTSICPTIDVTGPSTAVEPGDELTFTANVQGIDLKNLTYDWAVSVGTIESGQGTPVIKVRFPPEMSGYNISAVVEVQGFPAGCANTDSDTVPIQRGDPFPAYDYEKISFSKEKSRLDAIAVELNKDKNALAYFLIYYTKKDTALKTRINNIVKYLTKVHKIPKERFITVTIKGDESRTRIYLIPKSDSKK